MKLNKKRLNLSSLVTKRTDFLQANFALIKTGVFFSFIAFLVLSVYVFYKIVTRSNPPSYSFNGRTESQLVRLNLPKISNEAVMRWASQAISEIYSFNFVNVDQHVEEIKSNFTEDGYQEFLAGAQDLINDAKIKNLIYQANSCDVVSIQDTFKVNTEDGYNTLWLLQIPLIIAIEGRSGIKERSVQRYVIMATVEGGNNVREDKSIALVGINMQPASGRFCKLPT